MKRVPIERAAAIAAQNNGVVSVRPLHKTAVGLVITGNEIYHGLIQDQFAPILKSKIESLGSTISQVDVAPDDIERISKTIQRQIADGCRLILLTGGMSVDPDDVTRLAIQKAGADAIHYKAAALPGAMFLTAYIGEIPLLGVPGCGLHHQVTVLDLILPRILAGERIEKRELAFLGHGGLCKDCPDCTYPHCPFGKGN
jgi:molybdenum cofactor synthesis domain-containing protein